MTSQPPRAERNVVITIDGPAASGKSTTARAVARELGMRYGDSGSLYRAATAARIGRGGDPSTWTEDSVLVEAANISVRAADGVFAVFIGRSDAANLLRSPAVTSHVSLVAKMPRVRDWVNDRIRDCARMGPIVVDGRDMGTAVFPDAPLKIWLVADTAERARRRSVEILGRLPSDDELAHEASALTTRDAKDSTQSQPAPDAVHVDTTRLTPAGQVSQIVALATERLGLRPVK